MSSVGDGGASWLRRALRRAQEQAAAENRSLEEVAAERWGSLQKLKDMLAAAEEKDSSSSSGCSNDVRKTADSRRADRRGWKAERSEERKESSEADLKSKFPTLAQVEKKQRGFVAPRRGRDESPPDQPVEPTVMKAKPLPRETARKLPGWKSKDFYSATSSDSLHVVGTRQEESDDCEMVSMEAEVDADLQRAALSDADMNKLSAKILKAEMMGNQTQADKLKSELEAARKAKAAGLKPMEKVEDKEILLVRTDPKTGVTMPYRKPAAASSDEPMQTRDADHQREQIRELLDEEKRTTAEDQDLMFATMTARSSKHKLAEDFVVDDRILSAKHKKKVAKDAAKAELEEKQQIMRDAVRYEEAVEGCKYCLSGGRMLKSLVIAVGLKTFLTLPPTTPLTEGHCLIVPIPHVTCSTALDEDVWEEMQLWRKGLVAMFRSKQLDCVFMESAFHLERQNHMMIECIPVPQEEGDSMPIYFKKALEECDVHWAQNKKLIDLRGKGIRHSVPKGFPYFSVDFGLDSGFAHVIEDENLFPSYFGTEIIGGILDLDHNLWRKPPRESVEDQVKRVYEFNEWWKPYDWTEKVKSAISSD